MRYGIFSDIHANLEAFNAVIEAYKKEAIDKYLYLGDVVGYAANPRECIDKLKLLAEVIVAGNHDWAAVDLFPVAYFNPVAYDAIRWTEKNLSAHGKSFLRSFKLIYKNDDLTLVHGTLDKPEGFNYMIDTAIASETFRLMDTNICFVGHTHSPSIFIKKKKKIICCRGNNPIEIDKQNRYIVNVGSVGQPRDGDPKASYCIYDSNKEKIQIKRIDYDIETTRKKIIASGLPQFLGDRLLRGI